MLSLLLDYTKLCPKVCPLCPGLTIFFLSNTYPMNTFVKIFVSLAWVSQILSFCFPALMLQKHLPKYLSLLINWVSRNFVTNIASSTSMSQTFATNFAPPPLGCHRVTAIRKVPARAGDRQSPKFAHLAGDGRSSSMRMSLEHVLILVVRSSLLQH